MGPMLRNKVRRHILFHKPTHQVPKQRRGLGIQNTNLKISQKVTPADQQSEYSLKR